jgi:hypothetical protein
VIHEYVDRTELLTDRVEPVPDLIDVEVAQTNVANPALVPELLE